MPKNRPDLSAEHLRSVLHYNEETGYFTWKVSFNAVLVGAIAGKKHIKGYIAINVCRKAYLAHRLAWLYVHGCWPADQIDHINGIRDDNRICNLRECTNAENAQNRRPSTTTLQDM